MKKCFLKKSGKLKASSLVESVMAVTIVAICVLIVMQVTSVIFTEKNTNSHANISSKLKEKELVETIRNGGNLAQSDFDFEIYKIEVHFVKANTIQNLREMQVKRIFAKDTLVSTYYINNPNDEN